jgi:hypothetical protein
MAFTYKFLVVIVSALILASSGQASHNIIYGINDGNFNRSWATMAPQIASLGRIQVGLWAEWNCEHPSDPAWQVPETQPVMLTVLGSPWSCSARLTNRYERTRFARYVRRLVDLHPGIKEVQVWNEPDLAFWQASQLDYVKTLARVYDLLPRRVKVLAGGYSPNALNLYDPGVNKITLGDFAMNVAVFYSETHRKRPIMDGLAYHPYWGWDSRNTHAIGAMLDKTWQRLPQRSPKRGLCFWWTETGMWTSDLGWPSYLKMNGSPDDQARRVGAVAARAYRDPLVAAVFNFLLGDEPDGSRWQSGLYFADGRAKPAFYAFQAAARG